MQSTKAPQQSDDGDQEPEKAEESRPAVQPELEKGTDSPPEIKLPQSADADIHEQVRALQASLKQRQAAVLESREQLNYAESVLTRLQDEYKSFELRLEKAGLNLTASYADLLKQRLERLQRQSIAEDLIEGIESKLSTAREEQLRLEEFE
ncbi:MAG: mechanosensitive ion channel protein MscS, partial [Marinobacter sp.]